MFAVVKESVFVATITFFSIVFSRFSIVFFTLSYSTVFITFVVSLTVCEKPVDLMWVEVKLEFCNRVSNWLFQAWRVIEIEVIDVDRYSIVWQASVSTEYHDTEWFANSTTLLVPIRTGSCNLFPIANTGLTPDLQSLLPQVNPLKH